MARTPRRKPVQQSRKTRKSNKKLGRGRKPATGIDIGTYSVKILTLHGDDEGNLDVRKITVVRLKPAEGAEYAEELLERQKAALKEAVKKHGTMEGCVVLGLPREKVTVRYLTLPSSNLEEIREMLFFDVERHVPFSLDDLELSFQVIEQTGEHESNIIMVCVPRKEIEPYMDMCKELGVEIDRVDMDVYGDCAVYSRSLKPGEAVALVNFGRSSVKLAIVQDQKLLFSRSLPVSEGHLLAGFPGAKSWRDLQGRVTAAGPLHPTEREHFASWVDRLSLELLRSISSFACENPSIKVGRMILFGGAGYFPAGPPTGLNLRIKTNTSIEPALNGDLPPGEGYQGCELSTCAGLALRGLLPEKTALNLLPEAFVQERLQSNKSAFRKNIAILMFMMLTLLGGTGYLYWYERYLSYSMLENFYKERFAQSSDLSKMRNELTTVEHYLDEEQSCLSVIQAVLKILPEKSYISNLYFAKRKTLEINGQLESEQEFQQFLEKLISLGPEGTDKKFFTNVKPNTDIKPLSLGRVTKNVVDFNVTCYLWWEEDKKSK